MVPQLLILLYIFKLGQGIQIFDGQYHLCEVVIEQRSFCCLPLLKTSGLILTLAVLEKWFNPTFSPGADCAASELITLGLCCPQ